MKDTEIHVGLENETIREAICNGLINSDINCHEKTPLPVYPKGDDIGVILWRIEVLKNDIKVKEKDIDNSVRLLAYVKLMKEYGWEEHDISDELGKTGEHYRSFIGTEEEYNNLLNKIK